MKRVYEDLEEEDGLRFLVDRLWPRGIKKENLKIDGWLKEVAPSTELRKWFHKNLDKFDEFRILYTSELDTKPEIWAELLAISQNSDLTLLYASRNEERNHAIVIKEYLERKLTISSMNNR